MGGIDLSAAVKVGSRRRMTGLNSPWIVHLGGLKLEERTMKDRKV